jgi:uroporphyrinogen-III synthase
MPSDIDVLQDTTRLTALRGKRVLVTRAATQAHELVARLQELGAVPIVLPVIHIVPPADNYVALDAALGQLATFDWVVFTSPNGVTHVCQRLTALGLEARALATVRLAAIGPATAAVLATHGLQAEVVPERYIAEALLEAMPHPAGQRFLLPRADLAREALRIGLQAAGAEVVEVPAYSTVLAELSPQARTALEAGVDILTFTSSSTVRNFVEQVGPAMAQRLAAQARVVTIGPITAETARELGLRVDVVATEYTIAGLVDAMVAMATA